MVRFVQVGLSIALALFLATGCQVLVPAPAVSPTAAQPSVAGEAVDLDGIKQHLLGQLQELKRSTAALKEQSDRYYALATSADFDYGTLWMDRPDEVVTTLEAARVAWMAASPGYEKAEGIVAGTPSLAEFDVILDAGASGAEDPEGAVPFDLTLPDGRVLPKPGNLFGVTESTLWGTASEFVVAGVVADWDGDGVVGFGEVLPDAQVLKGGVDALDTYAGELLAAAEAWDPTLSDAFTALVVMVPTMNEYFASWRDSRFVTGEASTQRDFVAISRLADIQDILSGLEVVFVELRPMAETVDADQAALIAAGMRDLKDFVAGVYAEEQAGRRFSPEEADLLGAEAQNRATAITGQISQVAALLDVTIAE